jgi:hypothetical protein
VRVLLEIDLHVAAWACVPCWVGVGWAFPVLSLVSVMEELSGIALWSGSSGSHFSIRFGDSRFDALHFHQFAFRSSYVQFGVASWFGPGMVHGLEQF